MRYLGILCQIVGAAVVCEQAIEFRRAGVRLVQLDAIKLVVVRLDLGLKRRQSDCEHTTVLYHVQVRAHTHQTTSVGGASKKRERRARK
jgi:hypothetical protein